MYRKIMSMNYRATGLLALSLVIGLVACGPTGQKNAEKIEKVRPVKTTIADVEAGIRKYIAAQTEAGDGLFHLQDDTLDLDMHLVRVHTEYLSVLSPGEFFACVDLADSTGDVYDVDFFLKGEPGNMEVTQTTVHKLNGKPFYTWRQKADKTWGQVPVKGASNDLLGVVEGEDQFTFQYSVVLPETKESARMWIPVPKTDRWQKVTLTHSKLTGNYMEIEDQRYGNAIFYFEFGPSDSGKELRLDYDVVRREKTAYSDASDDADNYLGSSALLPTGGRFAAIADSVLADERGQHNLVKARALYDYIIDNMRYAKQGTYGTGDANFACDAKSGNCTEFHSLFISLARSAGIPARFAIGAAIPSDRNDGGVNGYHCWAEFYAEGKWWPVDISEANKYTALATYYFGHHPANRIEFSHGRDLVVNPAPIDGKILFLAYPIFEMEGRKQQVETTFTFTRKRESQTGAKQ